ncbi:MAG: AAA-like domain-containing protein [Fimbriimonas sp.]|nr:AAA-like domain-containing protein [Fimbriimonas sp.]
MATQPSPQPDFFVTGGTIPPGAGSYVERSADSELFESLMAGEYCYVLNARQMGKSSLAVHMIARLREAGVRTAFIDLTRIGGSSTGPDQWYAGLTVETGRALGLRAESGAFLAKNMILGPSQRFLSFLQEVALPADAAPLVVFIDEVDAARGLSFNADELFTGIRQLYNGRASESELGRLTFCLLGAALPSDLIRDPRTTPFNIGRRIDLRDFTWEEARPFAAALGPDGERLLKAVLYWTGGHPYLTQNICSKLAVGKAGDVDELVLSEYLSDRARDTDSNLADVGNRLLGRGDPSVDDRQRAETLGAYDLVLRQKDVADDESYPPAARIKMSGAAKVDGGILRPRNRIYERAFDRKWVKENVPGEELRRQRVSFWAGVLRTATVSGVVLAVVMALALVALRSAILAGRLEHQAQTARDIARYGEYVSTMRNMNELRSQHNLMLISRALDSHKFDLWRGWEWKFWNHYAHRELRIIDTGKYGMSTFLISPDGKYGIVPSNYGAGVFDVESGKLISHTGVGSWSPQWLRDSKRFLAFGSDEILRLYDAETGSVLGTATVPGLRGAGGHCVLPGDHQAILVKYGEPVRVDLPSMKTEPFPHESGLFVDSYEGVSPDGSLVAWHVLGQTDHTLSIRQTSSGQVLKNIDVGENFGTICFSPNGKQVSVGTMSGALVMYDIQSGGLVCKQKLFSAAVRAIDYSRDRNMIAASGGSREGALLRLDGHSFHEVRRFAECGEMEFIPGRQEVSVPYWSVRIYPLDAGPDVPEAQVEHDYANPILLADGTLIVSNLKGYREISVTDDGFSVSPNLAQVELDATHLEKISPGRITITDAQANTVLVDASPLDTPVFAGPTGAIAAFFEGNLHVFLPRADSKPLLIKPLARPLTVAFSSDNSRMAVSCRDGSIAVYRTTDGKCIWTAYDPRRLVVYQFAFSPDGTRLCAASDSDVADIYEVATGIQQISLIGHSQSVTSIAWSPDGTRIATGSFDTTIRLWDARTGADFGIIGKHDLGVVALSFVHKGRTLMSYGLDGVAKLWMTKEET